jgi:hypothetical protein
MGERMTTIKLGGIKKCAKIISDNKKSNKEGMKEIFEKFERIGENSCVDEDLSSVCLEWSEWNQLKSQILQKEKELLDKLSHEKEYKEKFQDECFKIIKEEVERLKQEQLEEKNSVLKHGLFDEFKDSGLRFKWDRGFIRGDPTFNDIKELKDRVGIRFDIANEQVWFWMNKHSGMMLLERLKLLLDKDLEKENQQLKKEVE